MPDLIDKNPSNRSLNLDVRLGPSNEDDSGDENKEGATKLSRFSSKLKMELPMPIEVNLQIKAFLYELINNACEKVELPSEEKKQKEEEEEEDDYFQQIEARRKKMEENGNKMPTMTNASISNSKFASKFIETSKVRIYLLNTQHYVDFTISINETMKDLKTKILAYLEKETKHKLKYHQVEAYELRMVDDDDDDILPNMELCAYDDKLNVIKSKNDTMAFVEKINFNPETDTSYNTSSILGINEQVII